jgi:hypothetical protein
MLTFGHNIPYQDVFGASAILFELVTARRVLIATTKIVLNGRIAGTEKTTAKAMTALTGISECGSQERLQKL